MKESTGIGIGEPPGSHSCIFHLPAPMKERIFSIFLATTDLKNFNRCNEIPLIENVWPNGLFNFLILLVYTSERSKLQKTNT